MLPEKRSRKKIRNSAVCRIARSVHHVLTLLKLLLNISASVYKLTESFPSSSLIFHPQSPNHTLCIKTWEELVESYSAIISNSWEHCIYFCSLNTGLILK